MSRNDDEEGLDMVDVTPQGPEKRWNYILWTVICGVVALAIVAVALGNGWMWGLIPAGVLLLCCAQYGVWAVRGRRDRSTSR